MQIEESEIYDLLYDYSFEVWTKDYGNMDVVDVNVFVDEILPELVEKINSTLLNEKIEIIS